MKDTIEGRILSNRRSLAADRPNVSTQLDGAGILAYDQSFLERPSKRARHGAHSGDDAGNEVDASSSQRLGLLEAWFGCSSTALVTKA